MASLARILSFSSPLLLVATSAAAANPPAAWPMYAHDFQRTGRADVAGDMKAPTIAWTKALGGALTERQSLVADVEGNGRPCVVTITGGRVVATRGSGQTAWSGALVGARAVLGVWHLDGSNVAYVVVDTSSGVQILKGTNGNLQAALSTTGPVVATFVDEGSGGILVLATPRGPANGYDFRGGVVTMPPTWTFTSANGVQYVAGDVDGDGKPDLVRPLEDGMEVDDPLTGAKKYGLPAMGPGAYFYLFQLANVDGKAGDEIVVVDTSYFYSPPTGIYVLGVRNGSLGKLWSSTATPQVALGADFTTVAGSAVDLDADGSVELVYSQWDGNAQTWTTYVTDATSGSVVGTIAESIVQAVSDVDGDGKQDVVVRSGVLANRTPPRSTLSAYDFPDRATGPVKKNWTLPNAHVVAIPSSHRPGKWAGLDVPVVDDFDTNKPGNELLVGEDGKSLGKDTELDVIHGADGLPAASQAIGANVQATVLAWNDAITGASSGRDVVAFTNDGVVHCDTSALVEAKTFGAGTYSNWILADAIGGAGATIFANTSNEDGLWIDGTHLDVNGVPYTTFTASRVVDSTIWAAMSYPLGPAVLLSGQYPTIVSFEQSETTVTIVGHDTSGIEKWRTELAPGDQIHPAGEYATDLTGDGIPDLELDVEDIHALESIAIFDGSNGKLVRSTPLASIWNGGEDLHTGSLLDVNGDGIPEYVSALHSLGIIAIDMAQSPMKAAWGLGYSGTLQFMNGTVGAAPLSSSANIDLFRSSGNNGFGDYLRLSTAGQELAVADEGLPHDHGYDRNSVALVSTGQATYDMISAGTGNVGLSRVRRLAGATLATQWTVHASGGTISQSVPSKLFSLHDPIEIDVDGDGSEDIVFGSDDGYVYAVRSSDGSVVFAVNVDAPVMHVIAANVDKDSPSELVASLADGRLVAIDDTYTADRDTPDAGGGHNGSTPGGGDGGSGQASAFRGSAGGDTYAGSSDGCSVGEATAGCDAIAVVACAAAVTALRRRRKR